MNKNTKKVIANLSFIAVTVGLGLYTQNVNWNSTLRALSHFTGAAVVPGFMSGLSSIAYEGIKDVSKKVKSKFKINDSEENSYNEIEKDNSIQNNIPAKTTNKKLVLASVISSFAYLAFSASWENFQFSQTGILQPLQYLMDTTGIAFGLATMSGIDGRPVLAKLNYFEDKLKNKVKSFFHKDNDSNSIENENINVNSRNQIVNSKDKSTNKLKEYLNSFDNDTKKRDDINIDFIKSNNLIEHDIDER